MARNSVPERARERGSDDGSEDNVPLTGDSALVSRKGVMPSVILGAWVAFHTLLCALLHGTLATADRGHSISFCVATVLAGLLYARLVCGDPGYVDEAAIREQLSELRTQCALGGDAGGSAATPTASVEQSSLLAQSEQSSLLASEVAEVGPPAQGDDLVTSDERARYFGGWCGECGIHRPLRSRHCRHCGRCVWRYDHHCFFLSNCIGEANQVAFWWYLLAQALSVWLAVPLVQRAKVGDDPDFWYWLANTGPLFACQLLLYPFGVMVSLLLSMHTFMAIVDTTSYETGKREKIEYLRELPECTFPFARNLPCLTLARYCALPHAGTRGHAGTLVERPPPFRNWPGSFWRNRYYSCC
ncbi:DHHC palmitoyltransferase-domain-containing protein [Pavlovales sp. CCMP2436]|nr:DHHC palmitoyltransferase-domain-containing protein [Pavlovales sp. CCMP2436]